MIRPASAASASAGDPEAETLLALSYHDAVLLKRDDGEALEFDVTRCQYAEMYHRLGIADLGPLVSCARDAAMIEGFNPAIEFRRTRTIMEGAISCDFRYRRGE